VSIRVFLADDHAVLRDGLKLLIEGHSGVSVVGESDNGRDAVDQVKQIRPDVVIMDIAMPKVNGIEATRMLRDIRPEVKVIILSMYSTKEHICRALEAGARAYLLKESVGKEVMDAIGAVAMGQVFLSGKIPHDVATECKRLATAPGRPSPLASLSAREREVLQLVVEGHSSSQIADILHLSPKSVDTYRSRLMRKLNISGVPELVKFAVLHGLTPLK